MTYRLNLDVFEGPFDLLLYLIKKNEIDIYDIPIASLLEEFLAYVEMIRELDLDVAGEFILMGATLMHIKSRLLLPKESLDLEGDVEADPRADLVRQLLEYKRYKEVARQLFEREQSFREVFWRETEPDAAAADPGPAPEEETSGPEVSLFELLSAFRQVLAYAKPETIGEINREEIKTSQKMNEILDRLEDAPSLEFFTLFREQGSRYAMITLFLAILELVRLKAIRVVQDSMFAPISLTRVDEFTASVREAMVTLEE